MSIGTYAFSPDLHQTQSSAENVQGYMDIQEEQDGIFYFILEDGETFSETKAQELMKKAGLLPNTSPLQSFQAQEAALPHAFDSLISLRVGDALSV